MDRFLIDYLQSGKAWLLVGSGPSIEAGQPSWEELASIAIEVTKAEYLDTDLDNIYTAMTKKDYPLVFQEVKERIGGPRLTQLLRDSFKTVPTSKIYNIITQWPIPVYLTTNYDDEIIHALTAIGIAGITYSNSEGDLSLLVPDFSGAIYKLHGDLKSEKGLVLTSEQYNAICEGDEWQYWRTKLTSIFQMNRVIVIGHSLSDKNISHVLEAAKLGAGVTQPVCWIAPDVSEKERREYLEKYRIRVITYDNRDGGHKNLVRLLESISEFIPPRSVIQVREQIDRISNQPLGDNSAAPGFFVFNAFASQSEFEQKRVDIVVAALQSVLPEIQNLGEFDLEDALELIGWPKDIITAAEFIRTLRSQSISQELFKTKEGKLIVSDKGLAISLENRKLFNHAQENFKNSLVLRIKREFDGLSDKQAQQISSDIVNSLAMYYREGGLSLASTLFSNDRRSVVPSSIIPFITSAATKYDDLAMRLAFFKVSVDAFVHPEAADMQFLGRISQGFFAFNALGVFGDAAIERLRNAKDTVWLIDSDTQIRVLAVGSVTGIAYRECVLKLKELGIRLFTTTSLSSETREHLWFAERVIRDNGPDSPYVYLAAQGETPYKKPNLFLEGFIRWQDAGNPCNWQSYLYEIFGHHKYQDIDIKKTLQELGIEIIELQAWPGFIEDHFARVEYYTGTIAGIWESTHQQWIEEDAEQIADPYRKAKPEAEALLIALKEREGEYYIISERGHQSASWFISNTSIINLVESGKRITWPPEAFVKFASTLCSVTDTQTAESAFSILLLGLAQSGLSFLDDETIGRVFGRTIDQSALDLEKIKKEYEENLAQKYGEPIDSVMSRISPPARPFAALQLAAEATASETKKRMSAEERARIAIKGEEKKDKELKRLERYKLRYQRRQSRPTKKSKGKRKKK